VTTNAPLKDRFSDVLGDTPDPDLLRLVSDLDRVSRSTATPATLARRIDYAVLAHQRPAGRARGARVRVPLRLGPLAIALALLVAITSAAYSAVPLIDKVFGLDSGAGSIVSKNLGEQVDLSRSIAGFTVTLNRVYADANRVILGYTVAGPASRRVWNFSLGASQIEANGVTLLGRGEVADGLIARPNAYLQWFDASALNGSPQSIHLHIVFPWIEAMEQVGPLARPGQGPPMQFPAMPSLQPGAIATLVPVGQANSPIRLVRVGGPVTFELSVPFIPGRAVDLHDAETAGGRTVTLERAVVTPTETRLYLSGTGADVVGTLSVGDWQSDSNTVMQSSWAAGDGVTAVSYLAPLSDKHGEWTFVARSAGSSTAGGPWTFHFVLP